MPYLGLEVWLGCHTDRAMKMTMHIDEDVLAQVMDLTGAASKTQAVEIALRDLARRHKQRKLFRTPLYDSPQQWDDDIKPKPSDLIDPPDIDPEAVKRWDAALNARRARRRAMLNEPPASDTGGNQPT
jgi:Arc/MetJ family transcription regulator